MPQLSHFFTKILSFAIVFAMLSSSCAKLEKMDPGSTVDHYPKLTRSDFKDSLLLSDKKNDKNRELELKKVDRLSLSKPVLLPPSPTMSSDKLISFSVTDQVPLKDVLIELGRSAGIDVDIDPSISGGVIINAKNRPLREVLDRISSMAQIRYNYENGILRFERDAPYMKSYMVDYLSEGKVWDDVEKNLTAILSSSTNSSSDNESGDASASISINKSAGMISIYATAKQHEMARKYLAEVEKAASAQVLIEAKVVEVTLSDQYKTGIDWSFPAKFGNGNSGNITQNSSVTSLSSGSQAISLPIGSAVKAVFGGNVTGTLQALEKFGTTKTISSPRVHAINNQKATISFTDKLIYFSITNSATTTQASTSTQTANNSTKQEEEIGVKLEIVPSINIKTNEITLNIKPELSLVSEYVTDPVNTSNKIPVINTRKLDTQVKIQSGNVVVIGGLMKQTSTNSDNGVPFLQQIPFLGWLFKSVSRDSTVTETVIFIKATIINSDSSVSKVDREMQEKFDPNRRNFFND